MQTRAFWRTGGKTHRRDRDSLPSRGRAETGPSGEPVAPTPIEAVSTKSIAPNAELRLAYKHGGRADDHLGGFSIAVSPRALVVRHQIKGPVCAPAANERM
jgi:hypothetical protein